MTPDTLSPQPLKHHLNICIGTAEGNLLPMLASQTQWQSFDWVIIVTDAERDAVRQQAKLTLPNFAKLNVIQLDELKDTLDRDYQQALMGKNTVLINTEGFNSRYLELFQAAETQIKARTAYLNAQHSLIVHLEAGLKNLGDNLVKAADLAPHLAGSTMVVCAAGPSLDKQIDWLKAHNDAVVVVAISRVAKRLADAGVRVHFVVASDPFAYNFNVSAGIYDIKPEPILLSSWHVCSRVLGNWIGPKAYLGNTTPWIEDDNIEAVGPTVTNAALEFALRSEPAQIILAGVDLCYDAEGHTHCSGSIEHSAGAAAWANDLPVVTSSGRKAYARDYMISAARLLGEQIAAVKYQNVINLNPDALKIDHVSHPEAEAFEPSAVAPDFSAIQALLGQADTRQILAERQKALSKLRYELAQIKSHAQAGVKLSAKVPSTPQKQQQVFNKLKKTAAAIKKHARTRHLLTRTVGYLFGSALRGTATDALEHAEAIERSHGINQAFVLASQTLDQLAAQGQAALKVRQLELDGPIDDALYDAWLQAETPHRANLFDDAQLIAKAKIDFADFKSRSKQTHQRNIDKRIPTESQLYVRCKTAFSNREIGLLVNAIEVVQAHYSGQSQAQFSSWIQAMVYELAGETDTAIQHYLATAQIESAGLAETALLQMLSLLLKNKQLGDALNVAQVLFEMNSEHKNLLDKIKSAA